MTENFRALIVILGLSIPAFLVLRQPLTWGAISLPDYKLRTGLWLVLTFFLFVAHSFWLFTLGAALVVLILGQKDSNPLGLYAFLLLLAPPIQSAIEGVGGINRFLDLDWLRVLSLTVLLPTAIRLARQHESARLMKIPADKNLL